MGQQLTAPVYGNNCLNCTPGTWALGFTPKVMQAFITGITACAAAGGKAPPEGTYDMTQNVGLPCTWDNVGLSAKYQAFAANTILRSDDGANQWFFDAIGLACQDLGVNSLGACGPPGQYGTGGTMQMSMEPIELIPWLLTDDYNLVPTDETWFNQWLLDTPFPPDKVVGLYNTKYHANVLVKYES